MTKALYFLSSLCVLDFLGYQNHKYHENQQWAVWSGSKLFVMAEPKPKVIMLHMSHNTRKYVFRGLQPGKTQTSLLS